MPYLFKTKNKPTKTVEPEIVTIEHEGFAVELQKLGSVTLAERMELGDFWEELSKDGVVPTELTNTRYVVAATLAHQEVRQATLDKDYKPDFSAARQIALGDRPALTDENGGEVPGELLEKIWAEFWSNEILGWDRELNKSEGKDQKKPTGTKSS